ERLRVIIRAVPGRQQAVRGYLNAHGGHRIVAEHRLIQAVTADIPAGALRALENNPFVASVSIDASLTSDQLLTTTTTSTTTSTFSPPFLRSTLGLDDFRWLGNGVGVAVIDSG